MCRIGLALFAQIREPHNPMGDDIPDAPPFSDEPPQALRAIRGFSFIPEGIHRVGEGGLKGAVADGDKGKE